MTAQRSKAVVLGVAGVTLAVIVLLFVMVLTAKPTPPTIRAPASLPASAPVK